jgi:hypothetical protein
MAVKSGIVFSTSLQPENLHTFFEKVAVRASCVRAAASFVLVL